MSANKVPYLCGGVLFTLLKQAAYPSISSQKKLNGVSDCHSAPKMMDDYINALRFNNTIQEGPRSGKVVSRYVNCKENVTEGLPFANPLFIACYDDLVKNHYSNAMEKMFEFVLLHLDRNYCKSLVMAILYIIERDDDIKDSDQFFISPDGEPKTKTDIRHMHYFCLPAFLVGVSHYILLYRDNNEDGSATVNEWKKHQSNRKGQFNRNTILCIDREIEVLFDCPQSAADVNIQKSEIIVEEPIKDVQIVREISSSELYAKILSLERKLTEQLQPTSIWGDSRLIAPIESDTITDPISTMSKPYLE